MLCPVVSVQRGFSAKVLRLALIGTGAEVVRPSQPHPEQRRDVRAATIRTDGREPVDLSFGQRLASPKPLDGHCIVAAEGAELGNRFGFDHQAPTLPTTAAERNGNRQSRSPLTLPTSAEAPFPTERAALGRASGGRIGVMPVRISSVCIDAVDPRAVASFWTAVLGWEVIEDDDEGVSLASPNRDVPLLDVVRVPEAKQVKNRLHVDLRADRSSFDAEIDRLEALGARRVDIGQGPDVTWVVFADPEGNELCLLRRTVQEMPEGLGRVPLAWRDGPEIGLSRVDRTRLPAFR